MQKYINQREKMNQNNLLIKQIETLNVEILQIARCKNPLQFALSMIKFLVRAIRKNEKNIDDFLVEMFHKDF